MEHLGDDPAGGVVERPALALVGAGVDEPLDLGPPDRLGPLVHGGDEWTELASRRVVDVTTHLVVEDVTPSGLSSRSARPGREVAQVIEIEQGDAVEGGDGGVDVLGRRRRR